MANSSFEKINYNLRPNKGVERKMMCETLSRLAFIDHLNNYRYIGMGSPYFADFVLFHKHLGIEDLISIEKDVAKKPRFEFNIPYSGITMKYGFSTTVLPNLELDKYKNIVWLDYDDPVSDFMFSDIDTFFSLALPGSFFVMSVNVEEVFLSIEDKSASSLKEFRQKKMRESVGSRLPVEYEDVNFNTKNIIDVTFDMVNRQIASTLIVRNGNRRKRKVYYQQLFNFVYRDNATILTIGGLIFNNEHRDAITKMNLDSLSFIRKSKESYKIQCPNLTFKEMKALDRIMPDDLEMSRGKFVNKQLNNIPLIQTDIRNYAQVYRYYPNFTEANL